MPKTSEIRLPFPSQGLNTNWPDTDQPDLTSPSLSNVRPYSADTERMRGGSRPGIKRAYTQQIGGASTPIQWAGWLDHGFGDIQTFQDEFEYTDGDLSGNADWTDCPDTEMEVLNAYVHVVGSLDAAYNSAAYVPLAAVFDDFELITQIGWTYATDATLTFYFQNATPTTKLTLTVTYSNTELSFPLLGYESQLQFTLSGADASGTATVAEWGPGYTVLKGGLRMTADKSYVRVYWDGRLILSATRSNDTDYRETGFTLKRSNPSSYIPNSAIDTRLYDWNLIAKTRATAITRSLVAIAGKDLWSDVATPNTMAEAANNGSDVFAASVPLYSATHLNGRLFIVDGVTPRMFTLGTDTVAAWTASWGRIVKTCRSVATYRNRIVLYDSIEDPFNYYMSRQGNPFDFAYGRFDGQSAVAGNVSDSGRIGDSIVSWMTLSDNRAIIGCAGSMWEIRGDPAYGGNAVKLSDVTGAVSPNAWCTDDKGVLYFLGNEGLFRLTPGGLPQNLTHTRIPTLTGLKAIRPGHTDTTGFYYYTLAYDEDRHGILIFQTIHGGLATDTHYFYDLRTGGIFPEAYPKNLGPTCAPYYNATDTTYRRLLLGSQTGYLMTYDDARENDQDASNTAIASYVFFAPLRFGSGIYQGMLNHLEATLGDASDDVTYELYISDTPLGCLSGTVMQTGTWSAGWNREQGIRLSGQFLGLKLKNVTIDKGWSLESIHGQAREAGRHR